jgi:transposase
MPRRDLTRADADRSDVTPERRSVTLTIVAETYSFVIGVDTHARTHTFAILQPPTGAVLATATFPATAAGIRRAIDWVGRRTGGDTDTLVVVEGIGSYGAQVAKSARQAGYPVAEPAPVAPSLRRGLGKSDELDAQLIARSVLGVPTARLRHPRQDEGVRAALRVLVVAREEINVERTRAINALTALVRTVDLGIDARGSLSRQQLRTIAAWRARREDLASATARREAIRLARRISTCGRELADNRQELTRLVHASDGAHLLDEAGVGVVNAAIILTGWSHHGRIHSEAAFAAITGTCPIPASSGNTTRHRLNRGGDRRLNRALSSIALTRMSHDPATRAYATRRRAQGRTTKEIRRSLKRYIARQLYRRLTNSPTHAIAA